MPALIQGRIVYVREAVPDPQGRNAKPNRPFVVISKNEVINRGGPVELIAISHSIETTAAELAVALDWGPNSKTRLPDRQVAVCNWKISRAASAFDVRDGYVKPDHLNEILMKNDRHEGR